VALSLAGLGTILGAKAVSAAPAGLAATVVTGAAAGTPAGAAGTIAWTIARHWKLAVLPTAALVLTVAVGIYFGNRAAEKPAAPSQEMVAVTAPPTSVAQTTTVSEPEKSAASPAVSNGMRFQVLDANSGAPIAGAKLSVAYFRDGGQSKGVDLETAADGSVQVEFPQAPYHSVNLFVSAQAHVPLVTSWSEGNMPTNYVMKLPIGTAVGGTILDEAQHPVANARIGFNFIGGTDRTKKENIQYLDDTAQRTDANGRWFSDMMPASAEKIGVVVTHPDYALISTQLVINTSSAADSVIVMKPGTLVAGVVTDRAGQPIPDVKVNEIQNRMEPRRSARTDAAGRFELPHMNPGELELAVQASGFTPVTLDMVVSNEPSELKFTLEPGHIFRGHVVDENGAPISNAVAQTDSNNQGLRALEWSVRTDEQGRFTWDSAPADAVLYWFEAPGFSAARDESLKADGTDHEIRLTRQQSTPASPKVRITGTVTDEETGQTLDDFKVLIASPINPNFPPDFSYAAEGKGGIFDFQSRVPYSYQIQIQKDGYVPAVSTNLFVKDGVQTLAFTLHKDAGIRGAVLLPGGEPAPDAAVFLYGLQGGVYMDKPGEFRKEVTQAQRVQSDDHGKFSFPTTLHPCGLIAIHDRGYAEIPIENFKGKIVLQPWGRIQGKLLVGGKPAAGQTISLVNMIYRTEPTANTRHFPALSLYLDAITGPDGAFVFEKVPPGERKISQRLTRTATGNGRYYDTQGHPIIVAPGTVTTVELGSHGQTVSGRAIFSGTTAAPIKWREVAAELSLKIPGVPVAPKREDFGSQGDFTAAWKSFAEANRTFWASAAGRDADRAQRVYSAYCTEDGSFTIPDVPSGQYDLKIEIRNRSAMSMNEFNGKEVGTLDMVINVPENADDEHQVLDLGALQVPEAKAQP
jgi:uncharacterized GH25 family protein/5-hydroxyisourate hydrolase-like protein (transthyretin family)